jgi:hypothetical protein
MSITLALGMLGAFSIPAHAATNQLAGRAFLDTAGEVCPPAPDGYRDFPPIVMTGSLEGCWYTDVVTSRQLSSGVYLETGKEVFFGTLNGSAVGSFRTTYRFESKWDPDAATGAEIHGRCQHPLVAGSGTGGFDGATGRVDFKDLVETGDLAYRGHISFK